MARFIRASRLWSLPGVADAACGALGGGACVVAAWAVGVGEAADGGAGDAANAGGRPAGIERVGGIPTAGAATGALSTARTSEVGGAVTAFVSFAGEVGAGAITSCGALATERFALADSALRIAKNTAATNAPNAMPPASATHTVALPFFCSTVPAMLVGLVVSSGKGAGRGRTSASIGAVDTGAGIDPAGRWRGAIGVVSTRGAALADERAAEGAGPGTGDEVCRL
jgi:hypothetical protein